MDNAGSTEYLKKKFISMTTLSKDLVGVWMGFCTNLVPRIKKSRLRALATQGAHPYLRADVLRFTPVSSTNTSCSVQWFSTMCILKAARAFLFCLSSGVLMFVL